MKEVREQGRCCLAKVVARSIIGAASKLGLKIEVLFLDWNFVYIAIFQILMDYCRLISLEFVDLSLMPNL